MSDKSKIEITSIEYKNSDGELHKATATNPTEDTPATAATSAPPTGSCTCGETRCVNGTLYRCMRNVFGDCTWHKTTEKCS